MKPSNSRANEYYAAANSIDEELAVSSTGNDDSILTDELAQQWESWPEPWDEIQDDNSTTQNDYSETPSFDIPDIGTVESIIARISQKLVEDPRSESSREIKLASITVADLDPELREAFLDDATGCLGTIEASLLTLEQNPEDRNALGQICRELHTLKGAAGSVGLEKMADELHQLEDETSAIISSVEVTSSSSNAKASRNADISKRLGEILARIDAVKSECSLGGGTKPSISDSLDSSETLTTDNSHLAQKDSTDKSPININFDDFPIDDETVRVKTGQLSRLMDMLADLTMLRNRRDTATKELNEVYHELIGSVSKLRMISHDEGQTPNSTNSMQLSEVANDILEIAQSVRKCSGPIVEGNVAILDFIREFRNELVELRRTPVAGLFRKLQRVVRDAARSENKRVQLILDGEDQGIERSLQQKLYEPLLHIVRNCVCHGIEGSDQRELSGKPAEGCIRLKAIAGPELLVIEIQDDGQGLDYEAIRRRAIEKGLLDANRVASSQELAQLIFHSGFSTRANADHMAGRGVGMDVVASTLNRMRGWIEVDSDPGRGTSIRLNIPIPSIIQHVLAFRSAGQLFAIPMQSIEQTLQSCSNKSALDLSDLFPNIHHDSISDRPTIELAIETHTVTETGISKPISTIIVDEVLGPEEVVVRPLPPILKNHPFCSGATLSGTGKIMTVLDPRRLVESLNQRNSRLTDHADNAAILSVENKNGAHRESSQKQNLRPQVLVVDDSLSARKRVVRSLQRYPVNITEASNGREALALLKTSRFDAIFSDLEMPHISGLEFLSEMQARHGQQAIPFTIISSRTESEFTQRATELGVHAYLSKPVSDDQLDTVLKGISTLNHLEPIEKVHSCTQGNQP